jgi:hypothetical protein
MPTATTARSVLELVIASFSSVLLDSESAMLLLPLAAHLLAGQLPSWLQSSTPSRPHAQVMHQAVSLARFMANTLLLMLICQMVSSSFVLLLYFTDVPQPRRYIREK